MIPPGWTAADWRTYKEALPSHVTWGLDVRVLDLNHQHQAEVSTEGLDGQWNLDAAAAVDRTLQMGLLDVSGQAWAHLNPDDAPKHLIQVRQGTLIGDRWYWVPVFTGRPSVTTNEGPRIVVEAQGKESLHLRWIPAATYAKGRYVVDVIRAGLRAAGERRLVIPSSATVRTRLASNVPVGGDREDRQPWKVWQRLARRAGCHLFYDGAGRVVMRRLPGTNSPLTVVWDERTVLSQPTARTDLTVLRNRWIGYGKGKLRATVTAVGDHSPGSLAIAGVPWTHTEVASDDSWNTVAEIAAAGRTSLNRRLTLGTEMQVDVVPFHAVDPYDRVQARTPAGSYTWSLATCSVPLVGADGSGGGQGWPMTLGYQRRVRSGRAGRVRWAR